MQKFNIGDITGVERTPASPAWMQQKFTDILYHSTTCRCKVETVNPTTGEYRIVLQGTFDAENYDPTKTYGG